MTDGFIDFSFGSGDDALKKKSSVQKHHAGGEELEVIVSGEIDHFVTGLCLGGVQKRC